MEVATLQEIGARLARAKQTSDLTIPVLMKAVGADVSAWHRWVNAQNEAGCRQVAILAVMLGLRPDDILLKVPPAADALSTAGRFSNLSATDLDDLVALSRVVDEMTAMGEGYWKERPMALLLDHARGILEKLKEQRAFLLRNEAVPAGTTIKHDKAAGLKIYDAPSTAAEAGPDEKIGEATRKYGKKRKK